MFKIGTQNQVFFPENLEEKFSYLKAIGFEGFEIDGKYLVANLSLVKETILKTNFPVITACGGYSGWIGDFDEEKRINGVKEIKLILNALKEVGGRGIIVPAAWGMFTFRLPPMVSPRSLEDDELAITKSLIELNKHASLTNTKIFLEPLNRYQDHMLNTVESARKIIEKNSFSHVVIIGDFYHMNIEEDNICETLKNNPLIEHLHIADNHRFQPGSGSLDFSKYFSLLKQLNYDGYIMYECRVKGADLKSSYEQSIKLMNELKNG